MANHRHDAPRPISYTHTDDDLEHVHSCHDSDAPDAATPAPARPGEDPRDIKIQGLCDRLGQGAHGMRHVFTCDEFHMHDLGACEMFVLSEIYTRCLIIRRKGARRWCVYSKGGYCTVSAAALAAGSAGRYTEAAIIKARKGLAAKGLIYNSSDSVNRGRWHQTVFAGLFGSSLSGLGYSTDGIIEILERVANRVQASRDQCRCRRLKAAGRLGRIRKGGSK